MGDQPSSSITVAEHLHKSETRLRDSIGDGSMLVTSSSRHLTSLVEPDRTRQLLEAEAKSGNQMSSRTGNSVQSGISPID